MNQDHLKGRLIPMKWNKEKLAGTQTRTLTLKPRAAASTQENATEL